MSTHNDGGPAFPRLYSRSDEDGTHGMSLRDWFAGQTLAGIMADHEETAPREKIAFYCYAMANSMLAARERKDGE